MKNAIKILILSLFILSSCKAKKEVVGGVVLPKISKKQLLNKYHKALFSKKTVNAKISANYSDTKKAVNFTITMRLEKDKVIWLSASKIGFPVAKIMITPNQVRYYEKLKKTYFEGSFELLSNWLGADLNFNQIQNILLGQAFESFNKDKYALGVKEKAYLLSSKKRKDLVELLFLLNPYNFKVNKQEIKNRTDRQFLQITYPEYTKIEEEVFPKKIGVKVMEKQKITEITLNFRQVEFNKSLTFPFAIPKGYKKIAL